MSGLGHLAFGLAAKPAAAKAPLWALLAASEANDLLYFVFSKTGLETGAPFTMSFSEGVRYLAPGANPWSHGLLMSGVWSAAAAAAAYLVYKDRKTAAVFGGVVFSHWCLDFLMHANLPLLLEGSRLVGLGLENSGPGLTVMTVLDLVLLGAGVVIYRAHRARAASRPAILASEG